MDDPRRSAHEELTLARQAVDTGDLRHAAGHLAGALSQAPTLPEVHELLSAVAARSGGGLDLFPIEQHAYVGTVVARAHLLAAAGRSPEAIALLAAASGHQPEIDWAGVPWVADPELAARMDPDALARIAMQLCTAVGDPAPEAERRSLAPYLTLVRNAIDAYPQHSLLLGAGSALARRIGEVQLAIDWADRGVRVNPSKLAEIWLGYAYRSAGRIREATAALRRAIDHDPDDLSVYADLAGTLADHGRLTDALRWIDRALERDPSFDCAVHTAHRLRFRADGDLGHLVRLADFQREFPDDTHQHTDLAECCADRPWLGRVPGAGDAVADALRQVLTAGPAPTGELRIAALEAPSALRTLAAAAPGLAFAVERSPRARAPRRAGGTVLWQQDGDAPAVAPPSAAAIQRIQQLAHPMWPHPPAAYDAAVGLATISANDLVALLVHPPRTAGTEVGQALAEHDPALWVRCVQVWACLGLLHHNTDEPWPESARRQILLELVWGVEDWTTEAALFALVTYAWVEPAVRADVAAVVAERLADITRVGDRRPAGLAWSVAQLALSTPDLDPASRTLAGSVAAAEDHRAAAGTPRQRKRRLTHWLRRR
jgi:tetratricopeptide (TPR) repeat protein